MLRIDLTGQRFGRLVVLHESTPRQNGQSRWTCRCDCGREHTVRYGALRYGSTVSCGCYRAQASIGNTFGTTHGQVNTREYRAWTEMKGRCLNPNNIAFRNYGARGIKVCSSWLQFENFYTDMGACPPDMTLDRIDNNRGYEPTNCRWATRQQQQRNTRTTLRVTLDGETKAFGDWVDHFGVISRSTAHSRILRGWDAKEAITTPKTTSHHRTRLARAGR